jgi:hypothetical protein
MTTVSIYDGLTMLAAVSGTAREAWSMARAVVNVLAHEAGPGRRESLHREWYRTQDRTEYRSAYQRGGFRAVNTFSIPRHPRKDP